MMEATQAGRRSSMRFCMWRRAAAPALLLLTVLLQSARAIVIERPCCMRMTHVSGEFTDSTSLAIAPVAATELVPVSPFHACEPLSPTTPVAGRIALVQRGGCNFVQKVWHVQRAGAIGVVVMDSGARESPPYHIIMQKDENASQLTIPGVFVAYKDGEMLLGLINRAMPWSPVLVTLSDVGELHQDKTAYRTLKRVVAYTFLVSAVCALSSGLSIVASFIFNFIGQTWRTRVTKRLPLLFYRPLLQQELLDHAMRNILVLDRIVLDDDDEDEDDGPLSVAATAAANRLDHIVPHAQVASAGAAATALDTAEACSICLDDFRAGEQVKVLPCQHFYHVECIDPWLEKRSGRCPLCKQDAIAAMDDAPKSFFGFTVPRLDQLLNQEHWFHTFFLMIPASLVSCLIVNSAAAVIRNMWP